MHHTEIPTEVSARSGRRRAGVRLAALLALGTSLLLVVGCGGGDDDDGGGENTSADGAGSTAELLGPAAPATGDPVRIGIISDGMTPTGDLSIQFDVADATAEWLNEHKAGIGGRPIELVECETTGDPAKAADCANRMFEEDVVAVLIGETTIVESIWEPLNEANMPVMLYGGGGERIHNAESTFILSDPIFPRVILPIQLAEQEGADKVSAIVIDVPAAVSVQETIAPPLFEAAGLDYELVRIAPGTADMTPQMQRLVTDDPGIVYILGNDTFCIAALNGLRAVGFDGQVTGIGQCVTDATREAVPGDMLEGMVVSAQTPIGTDNPSTRLYKAVVETYGQDIDTSSASGVSIFIELAAFQTALEGISGDITPEAIVSTVKAMPEKDLPGGGGLKFRCNGKASPTASAVCLRGGVVTTLDAEGYPTEYEVLGSTPIED